MEANDTAATTTTGPAIATGRQVAPRKPRAARKPAANPKHPAPDAPVAEDANEVKTVVITLHDSKEIPPGGQFVGVNGKQFWLKPGVKYRVPRYVLNALNDAIKGEPDINDKMQVVGVRNTPRLPYTVHLDEE